MQRLIILLLMLLVGQIAMDGQPTTVSAPKSPVGILPPNYQCTMTVYDMKDGQPNYVPAQVRAYVIWTDRPLTLEYYVSDDLNGVRYYSVFSRETLDKVCQ